MGTVYTARQVWLERDVAVKVLKSEGAVDGRARRRLHREARSVARIHNPHVVAVHDYGETDAGAPFLVMELVPGPTAGAWFEAGNPGLDAVLDAIDGVLGGLAAAHARGILHRDLKPANMLLRDGQPDQLVLVDFGIAAVIATGATSASHSAVPSVGAGTLPDSVEVILGEVRSAARSARRGEARITREGTVVGTPLYMAPEQALGQAVGPTADVYAAAVVLYEWLAGRPPFEGRVADVMRSHAYHPAPPLRARSGLRVSGALRDLLARALAKNPADRPSSAGAMRAALRALRGEQPPSAPVPRTMEVPPAQRVPASGPPGVVAPTSPLSRARRLPATLPFVGREPELARLRRVLGEVSQGRGRIVLIEGRPGMGTSRLADVFTTALQEEGQVWVGRGSAVSDGLAHAALRQSVEDLLEARALGGDALRERLEMALGTADSGRFSPTELDALLGWLRPGAHPDARPGGWEVALIERALRVLAARRPVVLWLDDVGRSGAEGARALEQLAAALRIDSFPLLVLGTRGVDRSRPAEAKPWLTLSRQEGDVVVRLPVSPLSDEEVVALATASLPLTDAAAARLAQRSGGSPLVAGHLLRHLVQGGRLVEVGPRLDLREGDTLDDALPGSLREMMAEQLERARSQCRAPDTAAVVLGVAAALGVRFVVDVLAAALPAGGVSLSPSELDDTLDELISTGVLVEGDDRREDILVFGHPAMVGVLLDEVVSSRSGRRRARDLARFLLDGDDAQKDRLAAALVRLLERCGEHALLPDPALRAGRQALAAGRLGEAARLSGLALDNGAADARRAQALELGATANQLLGHHGTATRLLEELLLQPQPDRGRAQALSALGRSQIALGNHEAAGTILTEALALHRADLPAAEAAREAARTLSALAQIGVEPPDRAVADSLLGAVHTPHDRYVVAVSLGFIAGARGDSREALDLLRVALQAARSAGYRPGVVTTLFDLGWTERRAGLLVDATAHLRECLRLADALGRRPIVARTHNELGELLRAEGDLVGARRHYQEAAVLSAHLDGPEPLVAELNLAMLEAESGSPQAGQTRLLALRDAGRVAAWLLPPWTLTMALCEAALGAPGLVARIDAAVDALAGQSAGSAEAAEMLLKIAAISAEKGADVAASHARAAARSLLPGA